MNKLAPGSKAWKETQARLASGKTADTVAEESLKKGMAVTGDILGKGLRFSELVLNGRYGLLAATVGSSMQELHFSNSDLTDLPSVPPIAPPDPSQVVEQEVPDQAVAQQQLGQNMMALLQSAQGAVPPAPVSTQNSVNRGAQIANQNQAVSGNPMDTAIPVSITANSIPNSFANLMGSINVSKG
jgi:hypothetical protein